MFPVKFAGVDEQDVVLADKTVHIEHLAGRVVAFVVRAAAIHSALFRKPLVITSGNDGVHASGSKHFTNEAVDVRSLDISPAQAMVFTMVLVDLGLEEGVAVFDERANPTKRHWHCEFAS